MTVQDLGSLYDLGSFYDGGVSWPAYTTGRLLSAGDLLADQVAGQSRSTALGRAVGSGVVSGLQVTGASASLTVSAGFGLAPSGAQIQQGTDVTLSLASSVNGISLLGLPRSAFDTCGASSGTTPELAAGVYLLTAAAATTASGKVPAAPIPGTTVSGCADQSTVAGVHFSARRLAGFDDVDLASRALRNQVATACLDRYPGLAEKPDSTPEADDAVTALHLAADELPLATFAWNRAQIGFVDSWSVRRRVHRPSPTLPWAALVGDTRVAVGEARFLQFQSQLAELMSGVFVTPSVDVTTFAALPALALVPVQGVLLTRWLEGNKQPFTAAWDPPVGVDPTPWLASASANGQLLVHGADAIGSLVRESWLHDPLPLGPNGPLLEYDILLFRTEEPPPTGDAQAISPWIGIARRPVPVQPIDIRG